MDAGIWIDRKVEGAGDVKYVELPGGRVAKPDFYGSYDDLEKGHAAMDTFLEEHQLEAAGAPWEAHVTDPTTVADPMQVKTEISYPLK